MSSKQQDRKRNKELRKEDGHEDEDVGRNVDFTKNVTWRMLGLSAQKSDTLCDEIHEYGADDTEEMEDDCVFQHTAEYMNLQSSTSEVNRAQSLDVDGSIEDSVWTSEARTAETMDNVGSTIESCAHLLQDDNINMVQSLIGCVV